MQWYQIIPPSLWGEIKASILSLKFLGNNEDWRTDRKQKWTETPLLFQVLGGLLRVEAF